ncbi:MAG: hypothetical protein M3126_07570 [Candidatus Eremiobacteraeota bacterium]|nr:hypothetical protein [Candidatus Eremiobacteraeota bacterium]
MERRDVFENELTEEDRPPAEEQEDAAQTDELDPDVDSQAGDKAMKDDVFGQNERA